MKEINFISIKPSFVAAFHLKLIEFTKFRICDRFDNSSYYYLKGGDDLEGGKR